MRRKWHRKVRRQIQRRIDRSILSKDVFSIKGRGTVATSRASGELRIGDAVSIERQNGQTINSTITGIEAFRKTLDMATDGENVGILLQGIERNQIQRGDVIRNL